MTQRKHWSLGAKLALVGTPFLLLASASNKEIARDHGIVVTTVKIHVQHVLRKLDVSSQVPAAVMAAEYGLL
jgi:two-component system nitrate/nitrite response regulator NarL